MAESNKKQKMTQSDKDAPPGSHAAPPRALVVGDGAFAMAMALSSLYLVILALSLLACEGPL